MRFGTFRSREAVEPRVWHPIGGEICGQVVQHPQLALSLFQNLSKSFETWVKMVKQGQTKGNAPTKVPKMKKTIDFAGPKADFGLSTRCFTLGRSGLSASMRYFSQPEPMR